MYERPRWAVPKDPQMRRTCLTFHSTPEHGHAEPWRLALRAPDRWLAVSCWTPEFLEPEVRSEGRQSASIAETAMLTSSGQVHILQVLHDSDPRQSS